MSYTTMMISPEQVRVHQRDLARLASPRTTGKPRRPSLLVRARSGR